MKYASDFRKLARDALRGKWSIAVVAGVIASMLGAVASNGPKLNFHYNGNDVDVLLSVADQQIYSSAEGWIPELSGIVAGGALVIFLIAILTSIAFFVLGSIIRIGYSRFNLDLVDRQNAPKLNRLFAYFPHWKTAAIASFLRSFYSFLWSLLLVIPGIMASYSYAMTPYILAENPELTANEAIRRSKLMMEGNRWRLVCLEFSFIGWGILSGFTFGIGNLWLRPYREAATAAFYREVSGTEYVLAAPEGNYFLGDAGEEL